MSDNVNSILEKARTLTPGEKAELVDRLVELLGDGDHGPVGPLPMAHSEVAHPCLISAPPRCGGLFCALALSLDLDYNMVHYKLEPVGRVEYFGNIRFRCKGPVDRACPPCRGRRRGHINPLWASSRPDRAGKSGAGQESPP